MSEDTKSIKKSKSSTNINSKIQVKHEAPSSPPFTTRQENIPTQHHEVQITSLNTATTTPGKENKPPMWDSGNPNKNPPPLPIAPNMKDMLNHTPSKTKKLIGKFDFGSDEREIVIDTTQIQQLLDRHLKANKLVELKELLESLISRSKNNNSSLVELAQNVKEFNENLNTQREDSDKLDYIYQDISKFGTEKLVSLLQELRNEGSSSATSKIDQVLLEISRLGEILGGASSKDEGSSELTEIITLLRRSGRTEEMMDSRIDEISSMLYRVPDESDLRYMGNQLHEVTEKLQEIFAILHEKKGATAADALNTEITQIKKGLDVTKNYLMKLDVDLGEEVSKVLDSSSQISKTTKFADEKLEAILNLLNTSKTDTSQQIQGELTKILEQLKKLSQADSETQMNEKLDKISSFLKNSTSQKTLEAKLAEISNQIEEQSKSQESNPSLLKVIEENGRLQQEVTELKLQLTSQKQFEDLQKDRDALLTSIGILVERHNNYKSQIEDLKGLKEDLIKDIQSIKANAKQDLMDVGVETFNQKLGGLKRQHADLETEKNKSAGSKKRNFTSVLS
ncbi:unnamed protein product [Kuraishia capsulata CBS 1993]|uniref:Uncharacterized protein n=1 Tax=Kuraishia capsulata CBS 1993 TaxID=1382522 RepID=W6MN67_9ASCO|nr:uncharacterized protein KUCA_T00003682001 [Kuraishia capsulata CBS 1993]CDK27703.1 unnamed protein product [Kuraishia capsulata CBS 1993]